MEILPPEIILFIISFTDERTRHTCRCTCSTIAQLVTQTMFVIRSMLAKDFDGVIGMLKNSKAKQISVRFDKVPISTHGKIKFQTLWEKLSTIPNLTALDLDSFTDYSGLPESFEAFTQLESLVSTFTFRYRTKPVGLPPNLTKLSGLNLIEQKSMAQLLDLKLKTKKINEDSLYAELDMQHYINLTRLDIYAGESVQLFDLQYLTALKDLTIDHRWGSYRSCLQLGASNLESLHIEGVEVQSEDIGRNSTLTRLTFTLDFVKWPMDGPPDLSLWKHLTRLRELTILRRFRPLYKYSSAIMSFVHGLPNLELLSLEIDDSKLAKQFLSSKIFFVAASNLTTFCARNIPYMDLSHCTTLRKIQLVNSTAKFSANNLTSLETMNTNANVIIGPLTNVKELDCNALYTNFNEFLNLEKLIIRPSDGLKSLPHLGNLTQLTYLDMQNHHNIDLMMLTSLTNLVQLHICGSGDSYYYPPKLPRNQVKYMTNLWKLEALSLPKIDSKELDAISLSLTRLTYLSLVIQGKDEFVLTRLTNLVYLDFNSSKDRANAEELKRTLPLARFSFHPM